MEELDLQTMLYFSEKGFKFFLFFHFSTLFRGPCEALMSNDNGGDESADRKSIDRKSKIVEKLFAKCDGVLSGG